MKNLTKIFSVFLISTIIFTSVVPTKAEDGVMKLTLEDAVEMGLDNSIILKQVQNQIDISSQSKKRTDYNSKKLQDGDREIKSGSKKIQDAQNQINQSQNQINQAQAALDGGIAPQDIPLTDEHNNIIYTIPAGQSIDDHLTALGLMDKKGEIVGGIQGTITSQQETLNTAKTTLEEKKQELTSGQLTLDAGLIEAGILIGNKLGIDGAGSLSISSTQDMMTTMANVNYEVTKASYDIYKNQIAMLIQKNYYDVLKTQKMLEVKKRAMDRGKQQFEFAKDGFEAGMKAKDDLLLANVYYKGTQIEYRKAQGEMKNALTELKKNMNIPFDTKLELTDVLAENVEQQNLSEDLKSGLKNRLEMKKAVGEVVVYDLNFETVAKKYPDNTFQYKEAALLKEKSRLNLQKTTVDVENSIRQSYETLLSTGDMLNISKEMVQQSKESVEIAVYKYKEGFGVDTSLLKKLDLESSAGTIIEVLAAEENLAQVEEKVVEIMYGYNLSRMKYLNDAGKFVY